MPCVDSIDLCGEERKEEERREERKHKQAQTRRDEWMRGERKRGRLTVIYEVDRTQRAEVNGAVTRDVKCS